MKRLLSLTALAVVLAAGSAQAQQLNVKIGVMSDMSSLYADIGGPGSVVAAQLAGTGFANSNPYGQAGMTLGEPSNKPDRRSQPTNTWSHVARHDMSLE